MRGLWLVAAAAVVLSGCHRALASDKTVCPESRDLACMSGEDCQYDASRGCRVCRCGVPGGRLEPNENPRALPGGQ